MDMGCAIKCLSAISIYLKVLYASTLGKEKAMKHQPPQTQLLHHLKYEYLGTMCFSC